MTSSQKLWSAIGGGAGGLSLWTLCTYLLLGASGAQKTALLEKQEAEKAELIKREAAKMAVKEKKEYEDEKEFYEKENEKIKKKIEAKKLQDLKDEVAKEFKKKQDALDAKLAEIAAEKKKTEDEAAIDAKVQELLAIELKKVKATYVPKSIISLAEVNEKLSSVWISLDADGRQDYRDWKGTPGLAKRYSQRMALWQKWSNWAMANARGGYMAEPEPPSSIQVPVPGRGYQAVDSTWIPKKKKS